MENVGMCHVCGNPATNTCSLCGRVTCTEHLKEGACSDCRRGGMSVSEESEQEKKLYGEKKVYR